MSRFVAWQRPYNVKRLEDIFTKRYVPLYPKLFNVAVAILGNDSNEAADAVQEAMVKIWRQGKNLASIENVEGYALTVLRTTAIDLLRKRKIRVPIDDNICGSTDSAAVEKDSADFLKQLLGRLPKAQQQVMMLSSFHNLSNAEIAELTGLSNENVRQILCRARKKIRKLYEQNL